MNPNLLNRLLIKYGKRAWTAFPQFVVISILRTYFQVALFGCNGLGEFLSIILVNFFIGMLVQITLAFIKKGVKIMRNKFNIGQKPKVNNKMRDEAAGSIAWVN